MKSEIQINNSAEVCQIDIEGTIGIPEEWVPVIQKMGYLTVDALKKLAPGKFFNDLCGFNKKNKLGLKAPSIDEVKAWLNEE